MYTCCITSVRKKSRNIRDKNTKLELAPPYAHRKNAAEVDIKILKDHFISGLYSLDPNFPLATKTLNLPIPARINPHILAQKILNGFFYYNRTPLAPLGAKFIVHEIPSKRATWEPHGKDG